MSTSCGDTGRRAQDRGRLKIDHLVKTHLPEAPPAWDRITLFHLLTHTAGFPGLQSPPTGRQLPVESADGTVAGFVSALMQRPLESQSMAAGQPHTAAAYRRSRT